MKKLIFQLLACFCIAIMPASAQNINIKLLTGKHWAQEDNIKNSDTLIFTPQKYSDKLYGWGSGVAMGMEFSKDNEFQQYLNMHCSDESDPKTFIAETWTYDTEKYLLTIEGEQRKAVYKILRLNKNELMLLQQEHLIKK